MMWQGRAGARRILYGSLGRFLALGVLLAAAGDRAFAQQDQRPGDGRPLAVEDSPFGALRPGQTPSLNPADVPREVQIGLLHWHPIASRCAFRLPDGEGRAEEAPDRQGYVFVTMQDSQMSEGGHGLERGYLMANGLVRELEKGKTAPTRDGHVTTTWRTAGDPRLNVQTQIDSVRSGEHGPVYSGRLTVLWGDKRESAPFEGRCSAPQGR